MNYNELGYLRINAINYAKKYAIESNKSYEYFKVTNNIGGDCTNFVSQCLYAGGCEMIYNKKNPWWYNNNSCSSSWSVAHELYWLLKTNKKNNLKGPKGIEVASFNSLKLGDLIFFEKRKNVISHSSIITDFLNNVPLISQHTSDELNISFIKSWDIYKYHFLKISK